MTTRRKLVVAIGAGALAAPLACFAQQQRSARIPRIGLLWIDEVTFSRYLGAFRDALRAQGYVEGKNIRIEDRFLVQRYEQLQVAAEKLVGEKVTVIFCFGTTAAQAAAKATSTIPIIMLMGGDPVRLGLAANLSRPGANVTGITTISGEITGKRLEVLKDSVPGIRRVGVLLNPASQTEVANLKNLEAAASKLNLEMRTVEIRVPSEIGSAMADAARMELGGFVVIGSTMLNAHRKQVVEAIAKTRLPAIFPNIEYADAGGLVSYSASTSEGFRRAAVYVDKILKGAKPEDLPIEQPTKFELIVNLKTAKAIGLTLPQGLLLRADRVIE